MACEHRRNGALGVNTQGYIFMPTAIYFDCFSGISGDMTLGALFDLGLSVDALRNELNKLPISGWALDAEAGMRRYIAGTRALVDAPEQATHRTLEHVQQIIEQSGLSTQVKTQSLAIFQALAEAEGKIHGISANQVHFHEVGALDAIIDIVGVVVGLELLGVHEVYASAIPLGTGWTRAAHGKLPLPAPAVLALLSQAQAPVLPDDTTMELVTPTGAAILAVLATFKRPTMTIKAVGYGLGKRDPERPNVLRAWLGEIPQAAPTTQQHFNPILLETNIDDQAAEQLAYTLERLFSLGALDAWFTPIFMKKNRPAIQLSALVPAELEAQAVSLILQETTTLGIRRREIERYVSDRTFSTVETPYGQVRVKHKHWQGEELGCAPEYEDCARIAREQNLPLQHIYQLVQGLIMQQTRIDK
jgi:uncharacterized protein (TIGR00299 family) protein